MKIDTHCNTSYENTIVCFLFLFFFPVFFSFFLFSFSSFSFSVSLGVVSAFSQTGENGTLSTADNTEILESASSLADNHRQKIEGKDIVVRNLFSFSCG